MTSLHTSSGDAVSVRMILASIVLHGLFLGLAVTASSWLWDYKKPPDEIIQKVTLVERAAGPVVAEKMEQGPVESAEAEPEQNIAQDEPSAEAPEIQREVVQPRVVDRVLREPIPLAKRKRAPLKVEAPKEPETKKPEPAKKKEDPDSYLEKQKAALAKKIENRKKEGHQGNESQASGARGSSPDGIQADRELSKWFELVKNRINTHWSVIGENPLPNKVTIIGIQISDSGGLVRASVDTSSGDQIFDRSAMRAIHQAAPFPPLPSEAKEKIQKSGGLALRFTPKGIQ
ncbi:MAG: TonB family protein [Desulfomonile tiedjei]|uniref:TonB family protein n=1 Tax=Desulfomonile tiedjei TaxID=2358 RepID=A0A9D6Z278_9BACT|nr:TonB family protein [Desulfomonile tiedjei]